MDLLNLDGLWITDPYSIQFLIGIHLDTMERFSALLLRPQQKPLLLVNLLFGIEATEDFEVLNFHDADDVSAIMKSLVLGKNLGVDKYMRAQELLPLLDSYNITIASDLVDKLRAIKSKEEIEKMKVASLINDQVMEKVPSLLKVGVSEKEVADQIEDLFKDLGADGLSFDTIVAFGENCADPHAIPSDRKLKDNEAIIIDMGCIKDGYCSDMTRSFIMGHNELMEELYHLVNKANKEAFNSIKTGMTFSQLDKVARDVIGAQYKNEFNHRLGHGIGQSTHEPYDVSASNHALIEPGMCLSIEPGIYLKGVGGIRIENLVYIDEDGNGVLLNHVDQDNPWLNNKG